MRTRIRLAGLLAVLSCFLFVSQAAAEAVGQVIAVTPGAFAERAGETVALGLKSPVHATDTLVTDATGKLQVLFDDDSSVTLAQGTRLALAAVVPGGNAPAFKANLGEGMARFITGKIVEQNPEGFSIMTPESTIGIRGTIFAVRRDGIAATTSVFVLNTARQVIVNGVSVPGEHKITVPGGAVMPMSPSDIKAVNAVAAVRRPASEPAALATVTGRQGAYVAQTSLSSSLLHAQAAGNLQENHIETPPVNPNPPVTPPVDPNPPVTPPVDPNPPVTPPVDPNPPVTPPVDPTPPVTPPVDPNPPVTPTPPVDPNPPVTPPVNPNPPSFTSGTITGNLSNSNGVSGTFSFQANLGSGAVSGASMQGSGEGASFSFSGGDGYINPSKFGVNHFPNGEFTVGGSSKNNPYGKIYGDVAVSGENIAVTGEFNTGAQGTNIHGTISGSGK